jgi:hypothetical protein
VKTSISFRDRVKVQLRRARDGMKLPDGVKGKMTGNLIFTHSEVADILEDLEKLERIEEIAEGKFDRDVVVFDEFTKMEKPDANS